MEISYSGQSRTIQKKWIKENLSKKDEKTFKCNKKKKIITEKEGKKHSEEKAFNVFMF